MSEISTLKNQCRKHLTRYEYPQVIECCDKILEIDNMSWWGLKYKGVSLYQTEQYDEAIPVYEKHYTLYPDDEDTILKLIEMFEKLGEYEKALNLYPIISKSDETRNKQKRLMSKMKRYPEILDNYNKQLKIAEDKENTKCGSKQIITALEEKGIYKNKKQQPIDDRTYTQNNTKHIITLLEEKGVYQYKNKEYDPAYKTFQKIIKLYQEVENTPDKEELDTYYQMLENLLQNHTNSKEFFDELFDFEKNKIGWSNRLNYKLSQYEDSLVYSEILLEKNKNNIELLKISGKISYYQSSTYSLNCWKKILEIKPENTEAIKQILKINSQNYSKDKSLRLINSKLYIDEIKPELLAQKIKILESMTLYDEALKTYEEYLALDLPDGLKYHELTIFDKIRCMEQKAVEKYLEKNLNESYEIYKEISEIVPKIKKEQSIISSNEWTLKDWYKKVLCESINKSENTPEQFYKEFYKQENTSYWIDKIEFLINWKYFGNPVTYCNILLEKQPTNTQIKLAKANIYYRTKRLTTAIELYDEILKNEPENKEAQYKKFNLQVQKHEYLKAYRILKTLKEYPNEIMFELKNLAEYLFEKRQYPKSKYCYNILFVNNKNTENISKIKQLWEKTKDTENQNKSTYYMEWIDLINYKHKKYECPECGGKLIPIKYGYFPINHEEVGIKYLPGGCCVSNDSSTDYCTECQKEINMGTYGIDITQDNITLFSYTQENIICLTEQIEEAPTKTIAKIRNQMNKKLGVNKEEFTKFTEKLEEIGHIKIEKNQIKLINKNKQFHNITM